MNVLIVEDDQNKSARLEEFVEEHFPHASVSTATSFQSGLRGILETAPELVILDMTLPNYDIGPGESGGVSRAFGGYDVLSEMVRMGVEGVRVVVVTQYDAFGGDDGSEHKTFDELSAELARAFPGRFVGAVHYDPTDGRWRNMLGEMLGVFPI